ncbi:MAG: altronate dehydratase [Anaerolineae bacterium]|nr:altronate dehydratase [Anaerolineae bacterium]
MTSGNLQLFEPSPQGVVPLEQLALRLHPDDDVAIAKSALQVGTLLDLGDGSPPVAVQGFIVSGHKIALRALNEGDPIRRYGQIIAFATQPIRAGEHVHTHNAGVRDFARDYALGTAAHPVDTVPEAERRTFQGYLRANGRVGTRNYIAVISTVNCSAHTSRQIAHHFTRERLAAYPNVDGVIALTHSSGCATRVNGADYVLLQRSLAGMARHPNVAAYILVGLGCETNQVADLMANYGLDGAEAAPHLTIQDTGGIRKTVEAGIAAVEALLPIANQATRSTQPISELMLALQCGGSDGWSGVTANPALGLLSDEIVRQGGTVVLAETPEIYGAEHLLTRRAIDRAVGEKLIDKVRWWEAHAARLGIEIDNNPSAGNKAGGLTTIYEKSLGAVAKGGSTPLTGVYDYAEPVTARGFTFMDSPGYDPVSVTGQVAGGCNLVLFTTGRGSVFGFKPAPSIKISTNSATYERMTDDMDVNAGAIMEGCSMESVATEMLELAIRVASGEPSKSEAQDVGEDEFNPWTLGGTL